MISMFQEDRDKHFKTKVQILLFLIFLLFIALVGIHWQRADNALTTLQNYDEIAARKVWLAKYKEADMKKFLSQMLPPATLADVETIRAEKVNLCLKHQVLIQNVNNQYGAGKPAGNGSRLKYMTSTLSVAGTWEQLSACLQEFNNDHLTAISEIHLETDQTTGLIKARITYRIYYL